MDQIYSTLIVGAILATISGLAVLAVKYPDVYKDIYIKIAVGLFIIFFLIGSFIIGYDLGASNTINVIKNMPDNFHYPGERTIDMVSIYSTVSIWFMEIYLIFLSYIGNKIAKSQEKKNQNIK